MGPLCSQSHSSVHLYGSFGIWTICKSSHWTVELHWHVYYNVAIYNHSMILCHYLSHCSCTLYQIILPYFSGHSILSKLAGVHTFFFSRSASSWRLGGNHQLWCHNRAGLSCAVYRTQNAWRWVTLRGRGPHGDVMMTSLVENSPLIQDQVFVLVICPVCYVLVEWLTR